MNDRISSEDQEILYQLKMSAANANATAKVSSLEYENALLRMYLKYGLSVDDSINEATGEIRIGKKDEESTDDEDDAGTG